MGDWYTVLDVAPDATLERIKKAYRAKNRSTHPDIAGPGHEGEFDLVQKAYAVLGDEGARALYDKERAERFRPKPQGFEQPTAREHPSHERASGERTRESQPGQPREDAFFVDYSGNRRNPPLYASRLPWMCATYDEVRFTRMAPAWLVSLGCLLVAFAAAGALWFVVSSYMAAGVVVASVVLAARKWKRALRARTWVLASLATSALIAAPVVWGAVSGWAVVAAAALVLVASAALGFMLWYRQPRRLSRGSLKAHNVYGVPGGNLGSAPFGSRNSALGVDGERLTAALMGQLVCMPGVRIFHSLRFPGSKVADIDHIAVAGRRVLIVDSKAWAASRVDFDAGTGELVVQLLSGSRELRVSQMSEAASSISSALRRVCPTVEVRTLTVIHPTSVQEAAVVVNATEGAPDMAVAGDDFLAVAGEWLSAGEPSVVNVDLVSDLYARVVS